MIDSKKEFEITLSAYPTREVRLRYPHEEDCKETYPLELRIENGNVYSYMSTNQARELARVLEFAASQIDD